MSTAENQEVMGDELCAAVSAQDLDLIRKLIQNGSNPDTLNSGKHLPLNMAVNIGNREIVEILLQSGCSVNTCDGLGRFPLHEAALPKQDDSVDVVGLIQLLIEHGAAVDAKDFQEETPLMVACYWSNADVVETLAERTADINYQTTPTDRAAIHYAAMRQDVDLVSVLLKHGAASTLRDDDYETPLIIATRSNSVVAVQALLSTECLVNFKGFMDYTALHWAVYANHDEIAKLLLEHGASVSVKNCVQRLPLHMAASCNSVESACLLLVAGANTECVDSNGVTPLIAATQHGYGSVVKVLLHANANTDHCTESNRSPLLIALECNFTDIAKDLIAAGCSLKPYWENRERFLPNKGPEFFRHMAESSCKLRDIVQNHIMRVPSLQESCRGAIRRKLTRGHQVHDDISTLKLPKAHKDYIDMKHIFH